jgi:hypothetical protein
VTFVNASRRSTPASPRFRGAPAARGTAAEKRGLRLRNRSTAPRDAFGPAARHRRVTVGTLVDDIARALAAQPVAVDRALVATARAKQRRLAGTWGGGARAHCD